MTPQRLPFRSRAKEEVFGVAILAASIVFAIAFGAQRARRAVPIAARAGQITEIGGPLGRFALFPTSGRIEVTSADGRSRLDIEMSLVVDGIERPLVMRRRDVELRDKTMLAAIFPIEIGEERAVGVLEMRMSPQSDFVATSLVVTPDVGSSPHSYALKFDVAPGRRSVFLPGTGALPDMTTIEGKGIVIDDDVHPVAIVATEHPLAITETPPDVERPGAESRVLVSTRTEGSGARPSGATPKPARLELGIVIGASSQAIWSRIFALRHLRVARVAGVVTGTRDRANVVALDEEGRPELRAVVDPQGRFEIEAPATALQWYAALEAAQTSAPVRFVPGSPGDLRLDVSPGGELHVRIIDADTGQPVVARLLVKGIEGTLDPTFGPDYRASGAGPLMDVLDGDVTTPLPAGHYRVSATHGIEWSIDAEKVDVASGRTRNVELALRHVIDTPGIVGCDLHVHARPSFDAPVTVEDRVLSLVAAGVEFAVPTEHNIVGDYAPAVEILKVGKQFAHVTGVEVTTYNPRFGHFGVFPFPPGGVPPYRGTTTAAIFSAARRGDPSRIVQVNHPRLPMGIGYFQVVNFDPKAGRVPAGMRADFDTLEVYNGYDIANRPRVEQVMTDWYALLNMGKHIAATGSSDSHRIQYQWAGYPRTYATLDPRHAGDTGQGVDTSAVVAALKKGRSSVTSGPIIDFEVQHEGKVARSGDEISVAHSASVRCKLRVRAAPWVDVSDVQVIAGTPAMLAPKLGGPPAQTPATTTVLYRSKPEERPTKLGKEVGTLEAVAAETVRLDANITVEIPEGARWILVVAKGDRLLDDALPFMPVQPLAFTNPIWVNR